MDSWMDLMVRWMVGGIVGQSDAVGGQCVRRGKDRSINFLQDHAPRIWHGLDIDHALDLFERRWCKLHKIESSVV